MTLDALIALVGFAFAMSITPGPGNFLLLASGVNFGFARTLPMILGISFGFLTMVFCVGMGLGEVLTRLPAAYTGLKFLCAAYVLWLAWKIANSRALGSNNISQVASPIGFIQAALFQLVNPKAWAVALILTVSYTNPDDYLISLVLMIGVFAVINLPTISIWVISGVALQRLLGEGRRIIVFNIAMAILLVGSMIPVLLSS